MKFIVVTFQRFLVDYSVTYIHSLRLDDGFAILVLDTYCMSWKNIAILLFICIYNSMGSCSIWN